jgi:hypothetical protein
VSDQDWNTVFSTSDSFKAELVKSILVSNGISAVIMDKQDSFYKFGDIDIMVPVDDVMRAKHFLKELDD